MSECWFVEVGSAVTHGTGGTRYTDYQVALKTGTKQKHKCESSVRRRYSDFESLRSELEQVGGCEVPPLPTRGILRQLPLRTDDGLFDQGFIEERREGLEKFCNLVVGQPKARNHKCLQLFFQPGSSMGCGGAYGTRGAPDTTAAASNPSSPTYTPQPSSNMVCDICSVKFTLINRKKLCGECRNYFCSTCLPRETGKRYGDRICFRCKELNKTPPLRTELMKLRVKDLQNYLVRKHVNTKACVEKKDLVELVLRENGGEEKPKVPPPTSSSWEDPTIRVSDQVPLERKNNFPKSYVESSHRREWFEKLSEDPQVRDVEETLVEEIGGEKENEVEETAVELMDIDDGDEEDEVISVAVEDKVEDINGAAVNEDEDIHGASGSDNPGVSSDTEKDDQDSGATGDQEEVEKNEEKEQTRLEGAANRLNVDVTNDMPSSSPSSPRKFAHHSMVYLSELESLDDLKELSSKQVKEILAMNRVNFKGCVEKEELLKIVERLWKQNQKSKEADVDELDDDSLCKICMDAPVDCVMLECGHMCTCTNCGKQMAECPICRQYVIRVVRTFKS